MGLAEPVTEEALLLRSHFRPEKWEQLVRDAEGRAEVVEAVVRRRQEGGLSWRKCLGAVAGDVEWPTFLHWRRRYVGRTGPAWERLLDERLPPPPTRIPEEIRVAACLVRRTDRGINAEGTRQVLVAQFGDKGAISDASLRRIWAAAGLSYEAPPRADGSAPGEAVEHFSGGGGLALLAAAAAEVGSARRLAAAVQSSGEVRAGEQGEVEVREPEADERDDHGRFTARYNERWGELLEPGEADGRFGPDAEKRRHRPLSELPSLGMREGTLATKLMAMGLTPLLTERRGFDGLDGPAGGWLGVLGGTAYMPSTLDKALSELGLLEVQEALWSAHARVWHEAAVRWSGDSPGWLQCVAYVDSTQDPYWTRRFARAGKVSRTGRVMPSVSEVALHGGPGVPLWVETHAGTASLKARLRPLLAKLDEALGEGEVGRLTIVDSEIANAGLLWAFSEETNRAFVTVLKGNVLQGATVEAAGAWHRFRRRDRVREMTVVVRGKGAPEEGVEFRGVEMSREGRRPRSTLFVTNAAEKGGLTTSQVPAAYLSRWPHQEQGFRDRRNGGGGNRTHGYTGAEVTNVALETKLEEAARRVERAEVAARSAAETAAEVAVLRKETRSAAAKKAVTLADREARKRAKAAERAKEQLAKLQSMPRTIYARDTGRDNLMTCLKLHVLMLVEWALREYFGGLRMEWRTFIESFVMLPVTVRTTKRRVLYELHANPRQPERTAQLKAACEEVNRRALRRGERRLVFAVLDEAGTPGS